MSLTKTEVHTPSRSWVRELLAGAVQPSLPALLGALLIAAGLLVTCITLLTSDLLAKVDVGYFMVNREDDYAYLTSATLHVTRADSSKPSITLIGASATREAIADAEYLSGLMMEELGKPFDVHQLSAAGLTHWEASAIADCIAEHIHGVVVLEVSPVKMAFPMWRFEELVREPRLALDSKAFDEEVRLAGVEAPRHTGNFFLDHYGFFSARPSAVFNLLRGPIAVDLHQAKTWRAFTEREWDSALDVLWRRIGRYPENGQRNFEVMGRIIERLRKAGDIQVALLESVRNPRADKIMRDSEESRKVLETYEKDVRAFAESWKVPYLDITAEAELAPDEFIDTGHIRDMEAAKRYTRVLASHLIPLTGNMQTKQEK